MTFKEGSGVRQKNSWQRGERGLSKNGFSMTRDGGGVSQKVICHDIICERPLTQKVEGEVIKIDSPKSLKCCNTITVNAMKLKVLSIMIWAHP